MRTAINESKPRMGIFSPAQIFVRSCNIFPRCAYFTIDIEAEKQSFENLTDILYKEQTKMENTMTENLTALSDDELDQISGGNILPPVNPGPPICYCKVVKPGFFYAHAHCISAAGCPYYKDCVNPGKAKEEKRRQR